jgi:hypothetical protein
MTVELSSCVNQGMVYFEARSQGVVGEDDGAEALGGSLTPTSGQHPFQNHGLLGLNKISRL